MKETFITSLADQAGAFLGAVRAITQAGANIHRVSYNKAVDTHMLFLDVEGEEAQLKAVEEALTRQGYLADGRSDARVILLSFTLPDHPGALLPVLEVIEDFHFNISYISSQGDGSGVQHFKMGLFTRDMRAMRAFIARASALCEVQVLDYDQSEKVMDNTVLPVLCQGAGPAPPHDPGAAHEAHVRREPHHAVPGGARRPGAQNL